jgi:WD40 repeat protein
MHWQKLAQRFWAWAGACLVVSLVLPTTRLNAQGNLLTPETFTQVTQVAQLGLGALSDFALSPDGTRYAVAMGVGGVRLYDTNDFTRPLRVITAPIGGDERGTFVTNRLAYSANNLLAVGGDEGLVALYADDGATAIRTWRTSDDNRLLNNIAFNADGSRLLTVAFDNGAEVWDVASGQKIAQATFGGSPVRAALSPNGAFLAVATTTEMNVFDANTGASVGVLASNGNFPSQVLFTPDNATVVLTDILGVVRAFSLQTRTEVPFNFATGILHLAFDPQNAQEVIVVTTQDTLERKNLSSGATLNSAEAPPNPRKVDVALNGSVVVSSNVRVFDVYTRDLLRLPITTDITPDLQSLATAPDGQVFVGDSKGDIYRVDVVSGARTLAIPSPESGFVSPIAFTPDGRYLLALYRFATLRLFDMTQGGARIAEYRLPHRARSFSIKPDGTQAVVSYQTKEAEVFALPDLRPLAKLTLAAEGNLTAYSPDGAFVAVSDLGEGITIWDANSFSPLRTLKLSNSGYPDAMSFSPDGTLWAVSFTTLEAFDVQDGTTIRSARFDNGVGFSVLHAPAGDTVAVVGRGVVALHRANDGALLSTVNVARDSIQHVAVSPDNAFLYLLGLNRVLRVYGTAGTLPTSISAPAPDTIPQASEAVVATCEGISLAKRIGFTGEIIEVLGLPEAFSAPIGLLSVAGAPDAGELVFVQRRPALEDNPEREGDDSKPARDALVLPLHPTQPLEGGTANLTLYDLYQPSLECQLGDVTLKALPPVEGAYAEYVGAYSRLLDAQLAMMGLTRAELRNADPATLPLELVFMAHSVSLYDDPNNPNNLARIADGTAPALEGVNLDILNGIVAANDMARVVHALADDLFALEPITLYEQRTAHVLSSSPSASYASQVVRVNISAPEQLARAMQLQSSAEAGSTGAAKDVTDNLGLFAAVIGIAIPPAGAFLGAEAYVLSNFSGLWAKLLPSKFTDIRYDLTIPAYEHEDDDRRGRWVNVRVDVASQRWEGTLAVLDGLLTLSGVVGGVKELKNIAKGAVSKTAERTIKDNVELATGLATNVCGREGVFCSNAANSINTLVTVGPFTWNNIPLDEDGNRWTRGEYDENGAIIIEGENRYYPVKAGVGRLRVWVRGTLFGYKTINHATNIPVEAIQVTVVPQTLKAEPGEVVCFSAQVSHALDVSLEWSSTVNNEREVTTDNPAVFCVQAPQLAGEWTAWESCEVGPKPVSRSYGIKALSLSKGGIRGAANAPARFDYAVLRVEKKPTTQPPPVPEECIEIEYEEGDWEITSTPQTYTCFEGAFRQTLSLPALRARISLFFGEGQGTLTLNGSSLNIFSVAAGVGGQQGAIMSEIASVIASQPPAPPPVLSRIGGGEYQYVESYTFEGDASLSYTLYIKFSDAENFSGFSAAIMSLPFVGSCALDLPIVGRYVGQ